MAAESLCKTKFVAQHYHLKTPLYDFLSFPEKKLFRTEIIAVPLLMALMFEFCSLMIVNSPISMC